MNGRFQLNDGQDPPHVAEAALSKRPDPQNVMTCRMQANRFGAGSAYLAIVRVMGGNAGRLLGI